MTDISFLGSLSIPSSSSSAVSLINKQYADTHYILIPPGKHQHIGGYAATVSNGAIVLDPDTELYKATVNSSTTFTINLSALSSYPYSYIRFDLMITTGASFTGSLTFPSTVAFIPVKPEFVPGHIYRFMFETMNNGQSWIAFLSADYGS